ncbi:MULTISPECIES: arsenite efflux transporter metallochaperone ArsD [Tetragenococcus]|uniref:Repressor n=4 Tax=Tetragenococcus TaxID=51668 RepID=A0AA37XN26_9ENTE|nr:MULTISPECIES: arsenite efflux transporter metallochaperone ArsD [Tetragenococcus]GMA52912.1 repressor [Alicyclobacillus contaminans]AYW46659.1 arsenical resistance operon transcriptional repressor ArsD [Tetragenococcus koreensis]AYW47360.1 arsenical resistance operon transcriptional repressor ArsD [Tetragenococcus osmophilus]AYW49725.1 arsenical resistance operon transcriptional repressor ArsD [Tetragenococcus halophilus]MCF1602613.1 arsenite efflux transporter metallochaperone ArsD [Tetrag
MTELALFEPAMCCSTGVCGPSVNEDLLQITSVMNALDTLEGFQAKRYNLSSDPQTFVENEQMSKLLQEKGADALPATLLNGEVVKVGEYPSIEEITAFTGVRFVPMGSNDGGCYGGCCGSNSGCC